MLLLTKGKVKIIYQTSRIRTSLINVDTGAMMNKRKILYNNQGGTCGKYDFHILLDIRDTPELCDAITKHDKNLSTAHILAIITARVVVGDVRTMRDYVVDVISVSGNSK